MPLVLNHDGRFVRETGTGYGKLALAAPRAINGFQSNRAQTRESRLFSRVFDLAKLGIFLLFAEHQGLGRWAIASDITDPADDCARKNDPFHEKERSLLGIL